MLWVPLMLLCLIAAPLSAQQARQSIFSVTSRKAAVKSDHLFSNVHVLPLSVDLKAFRAAAAGNELHLAGVPLSRGLNVDLDLNEFSVLAPGVQPTITTAAGVFPLPASTVRTYRGTVADQQKSWAYFSISDNSIRATVTVDGTSYEITTDEDVPANGATLAAQAYPLADVSLPGDACGVTDDKLKVLGPDLPSDKEMLRQMSQAPMHPADEILYSVKGAFESDYEYLHDRFAGNKQAAQDYMMELIGQMSAIYERDFSCQIFASYVNLWDTQTGGYPYTESGSMDAALNQAQQYWLQSKPTVDRAFEHIFSGKPWVNPIGIAFLDVLCNKPIACAYSLITRSNPQQDLRVISHETGHNFGLKHTHSCSWNPEIDRCAAAEDGACFSAAQVTQTLGTIMSYCSQAEQVFHPKQIAYMQGHLPTKACVELSRRLTVHPTVIYFPKALVNQPLDTTLEAFYQNNSKQEIEVSEETLAGTNADAITITEPSTFPFTLKPGEYRQIKIHYLSTTENPTTATLTIKSNGLHPPVVVTIEAFAVDKQPVLGIIAGGKKEVDFKTHRVGETVDTTMATLFANNGTAPLRVDSTEIVGPDRFEFQMVEGTAPFQIDDGASRLPGKFRFAPTTVGDKIAYLRVHSNSKGGGVDSLTLKGTAKIGPLLQYKLALRSINFGDRQKSVKYDTNFTEFFHNAGSDAMQVIGDMDGPDAGSFVVNVNAIDLNPGDSYDLPVTLFATEPGYKKAFLIVNQIETENFTKYRQDTIWLLANIVGPSGVPGEKEIASSFAVMPNPAHGEASLFIAPMPGEEGQPYTLTVADAAGRIVRTVTDRFAATATISRIATADLAAGAYYLRLSGSAGSRSQTLSVVH
ncbi:MAG: choice-of-anchor D domain-containing protein [Bacteroidetes bacterium]|nr:choice-of-anchor D domain-containing protein [Bacteroidota bacterium]